MPRSPNSLTAVGIGVTDLDRSVDFYTRVLGMEVTATFNLPHMNEVMVAYPGRSAVILMNFIDGSTPNYRNNPVKLVFYVTEPVALIEAIRAEGLEITTEPAPNAAMGGVIIGLGKDPDGYVIELIQAPVRVEA